MKDQVQNKKDIAKILVRKIYDEKQFLDSIEDVINLYSSFGYKINRELAKITINNAKDALPDLLDSIAEIYVEEFKEDELKTILEFLDSPVGKKYLSSQDIIQTKSKEIIGSWSKDVVDEISDQYKQYYTSELVDHGIDYKSYLPPIDLHLYWR